MPISRSHDDAPPARRGLGQLSVGAHLLLILLVAVLALGGAAAYGYVWSGAQLRAEAMEDLEYAATRASGDVTETMAVIDQTLTGVAGAVSVEKLLARSGDCTLTAGGAGPFPTVRIEILDVRGQLLCSSDPAALTSPAADGAPPAWLGRLLAATGPERIPVDDDPRGPGSALVVGTGLRQGTTPVAAVAVFLPVEALGSGLADQWGGPDAAAFTVVDPRGQVVRSSSDAPDRAGTDITGTGFAAGGGRGTWDGLDGVARVFASAEEPVTGWRVSASASEASVVAAARAELEREALVVLAALLLLSVAGFTVHRRITRPLSRVSRAIVAAGEDLSGEPIAVSGPAEIAALASRFNAMLELRAAQEGQLRDQAMRDPLTGLPNRRLLHDRLSHALAARGDDAVAVLFLDLDRFKLLNDSHGHDLGDEILVAVARRLESVLREGDTLARFGGDEYVVLCESVASSADAVALADRVHAALAQPFLHAGAEVLVSASIGIAVGRPGRTHADDLVREADTAMYRAKQERSGSSLYDESLRSSAVHRLDTEVALEHALARDELRVHYQPILDLEAGELVAVEALVRWQHPERGLVAPADFLPVAEETGQIARIGDQVLREACRQVAVWNDAGHRLRVSVNVAAAQLITGDLHGDVLAVLAETGVDPTQLCLEITETTLVRASGPGTHTLERLRDLGVAIAVDDFGTGYSSLSYLREFPVTQLKIDRAFVSRLGESAQDDSLVRAIVRMAQALGLSIVGEGIESRVQRDALKAEGCDLGQGYLFSRPVPASAITALLADTRERLVPR